MRAKIVNQSSDFPVRRTGSYRHKKALVLGYIALLITLKLTYALSVITANIHLMRRPQVAQKQGEGGDTPTASPPHME